MQFDVKPTDKVGVIGIGGLGHLALQFLNKWGCDVTAFTSCAAKSDEARQMGAHFVVNSKSDSELEKTLPENSQEPDFYIKRLEGAISNTGVLDHEGCCVRPA
jgi:D-arabinose 1-dehydrogenase-like Zn-dependent alcohol dehydrogenase